MATAPLGNPKEAKLALLIVEFAPTEMSTVCPLEYAPGATLPAVVLRVTVPSLLVIVVALAEPARASVAGRLMQEIAAT